MSALIPAIISLLGQLIPALGSSATANVVSQIIVILIQLMPTLIQEYKDLIGPVKNIIAALSANPATTAQQLATLQALDTLADTEFDTAAAAATAEDTGT
jgi:hypothetical protein